jgi:RNA polymerase sigma factor (sigma-70 family)
MIAVRRSAILDESPKVENAKQPTDNADAELVRRVGLGDRAALAELYDRHATPAYSLARRLVGPTVAEDVVQDAFVALATKSATFDPARGAFRAWFLTAIHRRCLNRLRDERPTTSDAVLAERASSDPEPPEVIVDRLRDGAVREALRALPEEQREVLVLAYYGGLTQTALADRLDLPLGTVKARMRRGLIALRGLLDPDAFDPEEEVKL